MQRLSDRMGAKELPHIGPSKLHAQEFLRHLQENGGPAGIRARDLCDANAALLGPFKAYQAELPAQHSSLEKQLT